MPRAAENFEKMVLVRTKFLQNGQPPLKNLAPPFWARPPLFRKNWPAPPFGQFSKNGQPPLKPGGVKVCAPLDKTEF